MRPRANADVRTYYLFNELHCAPLFHSDEAKWGPVPGLERGLSATECVCLHHRQVWPLCARRRTADWHTYAHSRQIRGKGGAHQKLQR